MKEDFLHYIWNYKLFDSLSLQTTSNELIKINRVGDKNINSGPDFFNAQIRIDDQLWVGNVEIHIKSSDWYLHHHEKDERYDNVILHVVWEHDMPIFRKDNSEIPTLTLARFTDKSLLNKYQKLFSKNNKWINCENDIHQTDNFLLENWLEHLYFERLEQKEDIILVLLKQSNNDWETVLFKLLAKNFGLKVNGTYFFDIAAKVNFHIFKKEFDNLLSLEALLFGHAGLLINDKEGTYYSSLRKEYDFLCKKYSLKKTNRLSVDFFRLRPNNFPTIRLAQFASLYFEHKKLFSKLNEVASIENFYSIFNVKASSFWDTHYHFDSVSKKRSKFLTKSFIDLLLVNTIIPLRFIYLKHIGKLKEEEIIKLMRAIKPERNSITEKFTSLKIKPTSALESQAQLQLKSNYCDKYECLKCRIGNSLLKN